MGSKVADIFGSIIVLATVTTLVLPKRQTPQVFAAGGQAITGILKAATGQ